MTIIGEILIGELDLITKITTEGDCEGRTTREVGLFLGSIEQIMYHCYINNIKPEYHFKQHSVNVTDCTDLAVPKSFKVTTDHYNRLEIKADPETCLEMSKQAALSKLNYKDKKVLGLL